MQGLITAKQAVIGYNIKILLSLHIPVSTSIGPPHHVRKFYFIGFIAFFCSCLAVNHLPLSVIKLHIFSLEQILTENEGKKGIRREKKEGNDAQHGACAGTPDSRFWK